MLLIVAHSGFRLWPPHPVDDAGIMSGGFEPFLGADDLLLGGPALLGGERWTWADVLTYVYDDQPPYDQYADNNWEKVPSHRHASDTATQAVAWRCKRIGKVLQSWLFVMPQRRFLSLRHTAPLCLFYRRKSRLRERNFCATWLSAPTGTALALRAARW